jgi:hypothetical protein
MVNHVLSVNNVFWNFFEGGVTDKITLILSDKPSENSYLLTSRVISRSEYMVTLSNGKRTKRELYDWLHYEIKKHFGKSAYLSIE